MRLEWRITCGLAATPFSIASSTSLMSRPACSAIARPSAMPAIWIAPIRLLICGSLHSRDVMSDQEAHNPLQTTDNIRYWESQEIRKRRKGASHVLPRGKSMKLTEASVKGLSLPPGVRDKLFFDD